MPLFEGLRTAGEIGAARIDGAPPFEGRTIPDEPDPVSRRTESPPAGTVVMTHESTQVSQGTHAEASAPVRCRCQLCMLFQRTMARKEHALILAGLAQADARTAERFLDGKPVARAVGDRLAMVHRILADNAR